MELFTNESVLGICFFFMGILILTQCSVLDRKYHYRMRNLRRLEWDGRREMDAIATLPLNFLGSAMTFAGSALSLYGLFRFLISVF